MIRAAGVMCLTPANQALFLKRGAGSDHPGEWCFPAGTIEAGETAEDAAAREVREEIGPVTLGPLKLLMQRVANNEIAASLAPGIGLSPTDAAVVPGDQVDFTTFLARVTEQFTPTLNDEHTGWAWANIDTPPEPLHPGCRIALARLTMDELGIARAMAAGELTGPQKYGTFWLYQIRITGTGIAYRAAAKDPKTGKVLREEEYCWRDPALYLDPEFLARCNGLPVIWDHPENKPALDSDEFRNRIVGTTFLPFISGAEVHAIVKIYDQACLEWLLADQRSTSPAVVFGPASGNEKIRLSDGSTLLIEGDPMLLDHIALCGAGVWDKGGPPTGVQHDTSTEGPIGMTEEEQAAADKARKDASGPLTEILDEIKRLSGRMDSMEEEGKARKDAAEDRERQDRARHDTARKDRFGARRDGESYKDWKGRHDADEAAMCDTMTKGGTEADKARRDAKDCRSDAEKEEAKEGGESFRKWAEEEGKESEHKEDKARKDAEERERADRARHDAATAEENADLKRRLAGMEAWKKSLTTETSASERDALSAAQSRADSVAVMFGDRAPPPMPGEVSLDYRKRQLNRFKSHSARFKESRFDSLDEAMLSPIEDIVYADAVSVARSPAQIQPGILIPMERRDAAGRTITTYVGDPMAWMQHFMTGAQVGRINRPQKGA